eukprot:312955_1
MSFCINNKKRPRNTSNEQTPINKRHRLGKPPLGKEQFEDLVLSMHNFAIVTNKMQQEYTEYCRKLREFATSKMNGDNETFSIVITNLSPQNNTQQLREWIETEKLISVSDIKIQKILSREDRKQILCREDGKQKVNYLALIVFSWKQEYDYVMKYNMYFNKLDGNRLDVSSADSWKDDLFAKEYVNRLYGYDNDEYLDSGLYNSQNEHALNNNINNSQNEPVFNTLNIGNNNINILQNKIEMEFAPSSA